MNIPINYPLLLPTVVCLLLCFNLVFTTGGDPEIGKKIYTSGMGIDSDNIKAIRLGREMPATIYACASCHGDCGRSQKQQGIEIPDIRRASYIKRYANNLEEVISDREINSKIKRLITMGIDHGGEKVNSIMPTYKMSNQDMDHLLAYLTVLGTEKNCNKE